MSIQLETTNPLYAMSRQNSYTSELFAIKEDHAENCGVCSGVLDGSADAMVFRAADLPKVTP